MTSAIRFVSSWPCGVPSADFNRAGALGKHARTCSGIDFAVGGSPPSVAPSVGSDVARDLDIVTPYRIRDLRIGNEFL
ncbi:hypothetical protein NLM27_00955 [Bradyrhizobium sp. CCGB12]|uniref:hypothetical protein n=1 Tax=Bradyrhizobium sp. CCGB12 TaxID=2949632 RepID=UPI0020B42749|nr:hypothetical protein [Bradyrhizobium sp. CCGB12]MCP3387350.1 hypothetical protein [Bradyrhizobium sp. CCGB12]